MLATFLRDVTATFLRDVTTIFLSVMDTYVRTHIMRIDPGLESLLRSQLRIIVSQVQNDSIQVIGLLNLEIIRLTYL